MRTDVTAPPAAAERSPFKKVTRTTWLVSIASFINDLSNEMVVPLVPVFLTGTLGATAAVVGLIEGVAGALGSLLRVIPGILSDRSGRRVPYVFWGYAISLFSRLGIAMAGHWWHVFLARSSDRLGKAVRHGAREALIADSTPEEDLGRNFGFYNSMDTLGALLAPLLASAVLFAFEGNIRVLFLLSIVPGVFALLALRLLKEPVKHSEFKRPDLSLRGFRNLPTGFYIFLGIIMVFGLAHSSDAFLILRSQQLGLRTELIPLAYGLVAVMGALFSYPVGILADKIGYRLILSISFVLHALVYLGFALAHHVGVISVWPLFFLYGTVALGASASKPLLMTLIPREYRGTAVGLIGTLGGLVGLASSSIAGILWTVVGPTAPFALSTALAGVSALAFIVMGPILFPRKEEA